MNIKNILFTLFFLTLSQGTFSSVCNAVDDQTIQANVTGKNIQKEKTFTSVEERRLHTVLQNERDNLDEEKKVLALKEKELKTLQVEVDKKLERIDNKLAELKETQKKIATLLAEKDIKELKKIKDLSLIYAKMSPAKAALAMTNLNQQLAADLLANMKVKSAAKILDQMDKAKTSQLSTKFSTLQVE